MTVEIDLAYDTWPIGSLAFSGDDITFEKALDGMVLVLPATLDLRDRFAERQGSKGWHPLLVKLAVKVSLRPEGLYLGTWENCKFESHDKSYPRVSIHLPTTTVREIGRRRGSGPIEFALKIHATVARVEPESRKVEVLDPRYVFREQTLRYRPEDWSRIVTDAGLADNIYVEARLEPPSTANWATIYEHVRAARDALQKGGREGWRSAVVESRIALEMWADQSVRPPDLANWQKPPRPDLEARTPQQRADFLRWHLHQFAHMTAHPPAAGNKPYEPNREDAVMVVGLLAALLGIENR